MDNFHSKVTKNSRLFAITALAVLISSDPSLGDVFLPACCPSDLSTGFDWPATPRGMTAHISCSTHGFSLHPKSLARRRCSSSGEWGSVDVSGCTFINRDNAVFVVSVNISASRGEVTTNLSVLTDQLNSRLGEYGARNLRPRFVFGGTAGENTVLVMVGSLPLAVNSTILGVFERDGVPPGYFNLSTLPELVVYVPAETCLCGISNSNDLHRLCAAPSVATVSSASSCLCYTNCSCWTPYTESTVVDGDGQVACTFQSPQPVLVSNCSATIGVTCPADSVSLSSPVLTTTWPITSACSIAQQTCPLAYIGFTQRLCNERGQWEEPDLSQCQRVDLPQALGEVGLATVAIGRDVSNNNISSLNLSCGCYDSIVTQLEGHLSMLSPPYLPKELSVVANYVSFLASIVRISNLFDISVYDKESLVTLLQSLYATSTSHESFWRTWIASSRPDIGLLLRGSVRIVEELALRLDQLTLTTNVNGVLQWNMTESTEFGVLADYVGEVMGNRKKLFNLNFLQHVESVAIDGAGVSTAVSYYHDIYSKYLPKAFVNQSSIGVSLLHPVVIAVSGRNISSVSVIFKSSNTSLYASGRCVRWQFLYSYDRTYFGGWTDIQVETVLQEGGYNCTGRGPGVYGVIEIGRIHVFPEALQVYPLNYFTLTCITSIQHNTSLPLVWTVNGQPLDRFDLFFEFTETQEGGSSVLNASFSHPYLVLSELQMSCDTPGYFSVSESATVNALTLPVTTLNMTSCSGGVDFHEVPTGHTLCLQCSGLYIASPTMEYNLIWRVNGTVLNSSLNEDFTINEDEHTLTVVTPTTDYSGIYSCEIPESAMVKDEANITIRQGCLPQPFLPAAGISETFNKSCSSYSFLSTIKSTGDVVWTCSEDLQWTGNFTQCSFIDGGERSVFVLAFLVKGAELPSNHETLDSIERDIERKIQRSGTSVRLVDHQPSGSFGSSLITCLVETESDQFLDEVSEVFSGTFLLSGHESSLSAQLSYVLATNVSCNCPLHYVVNQGESIPQSELGVVRLCKTPTYASTVCENNECIGVFTNISRVDSNLTAPQQCSLDTDGDGAPDHKDDCESCCVSELYGGVQWNEAAHGINDASPCSSLHPSLNHGTSFKRMCSNVGVWQGMSPFGCTFSESVEHSLAVCEYTLNASSDIIDEMKDLFLEEVLNQLNVERVTGEVKFQMGQTLVLVLEFMPPFGRENEEQVLERLRGLPSIRGVPVVGRLVYGLKPADQCLCLGGLGELDSMPEFIALCRGPSDRPACSCSSEMCKCLYPYTVSVPGGPGEGGIHCTYNETGLTGTSMISNCQKEENAVSCPMDMTSMIKWPTTPPCFVAVEMCSQNSMSAVGEARRRCSPSGRWEFPNTTECESINSRNVRLSMDELLSAFFSDPVLKMSGRTTVRDPQVQTLNENADMLMMITQQGGLYPTDLVTTVNYLESVVSISEQSDLFTHTNFSTPGLFDIINNALDNRHSSPWEDLQQMRVSTSADLLRVSERVSILHAMASGSAAVSHLNRTNLVAFSTVRKGRSGVSTDVVEIPQDVIAERANSSGGSVPVSILILSNITQYLFNQFANASDIPVGVSVFQDVVSVQVGGTSESSTQLEETPVVIVFTVQKNDNEQVQRAYCVFWNYSDSDNANFGGWSESGLTTSYNSSTGEVTCSSNHLTSFSILVSVSQFTDDPTLPANVALHVVTYIGCALSFTCLVLSILFFLSMGKQLFGPKEGGKSFISFVHLNLCISLAIGLLVFMAGIENGTSSKVACIIVAVLLHYFFLSVFSWMLCEVIVLYNLLVNVFPEKGLHFNRRWWLLFFSCLGWGLPVPVIIVSLASRWDNYYILDPLANCTTEMVNSDFSTCTRACWLSSRDGVIAAFIVPMLMIIVVNSVLLVLVVKSLYNHWKTRASFDKKQSTVRTVGINLFKSILFLLPLSGLTWIIGLFAVNSELIVFAWLFLIFNTSQGVVIFIFYVLRHERVTSRLARVWPRVTKCWRSCLRSCLRKCVKQKEEPPLTSSATVETLNSPERQQSLPQRTVRSIRQMISPLVPQDLESTTGYSDDNLATSPTFVTASFQLEDCLFEAEI